MKLATGMIAAIAALSTTSCSSSTFQQLEKTVLADVENGTLLATIEQAVAALYPQFASDAAAIDGIIQQMIALLVSTGELPPSAQAHALDLQSQIGAKLAAAKKSGWIAPTNLTRAIASIDVQSAVVVANLIR
jgi:hypothetical protein